MPDGWYRTGDLGYLAGGELFVTGRAKDPIIVNGENVYPIDLEKVASRVSGVKAGRCVAFGVVNGALGTEEVVVAVEATAAADAARLRVEVADAIRERPGVMVADVHVCGPGTLAKSTSGKLSRRRNREAYLRHRASSRPGAEAGPAGATPTERRVLSLLARLLGNESVSPAQHLVLDRGINSLSIVVLAERLSAEFGANVDSNFLLQAGTVEELARRLEPSAPRAGGADEALAVCLHRRGSAPPVFVFPGASIPPREYIGLAPYFRDRPVYVLQDPYFMQPDGCFRDIQSMASAYRRAVRRLQPEEPYALLGDCLRGFVAYELCRQLCAAGEPAPKLVFLETYGTRTMFLRRLAWSQKVSAVLGWALFGVPSLRRPFRRQVAELQALPARQRLWGTELLDPRDRRRNEVVRFAFPGMFDDTNLAALPAEQAWSLVVERLVAAGQLARPEVSAATLRHRGYLQLQYLQLMSDYRPPFFYPGAIVQFSQEGRHYEGWARYSREPLRRHRLVLEPTERFPDPHNALLQPINLKQFAESLVESLSTQ